MNAFANEHLFRRPQVRLLALGRGRVRGSAEETMNGGIKSPSEYVIPAGTDLYRFGWCGVPDIVLSGEWWNDGHALRQADAFGAAHGMALREALRHACFIPEEWGSDQSTVVSLVTRAPLLAYRGKAAVVSIRDKHGITTRLMNERTERFRINQLYIPGLGSRDVRRAAIGTIRPIFLPPA